MFITLYNIIIYIWVHEIMQFCVYATSIAIMIHVDYANLCQNVKSMRVIASGAITAQGAGITWNFIVQIIFLYFRLFVLTTNVLCVFASLRSYLH